MIRRCLKGLGLFLIVAAPAWGVISLIVVSTMAGQTLSGESVGAMLDAMFKNVIPTVVAGGGLWLLASIDERLERKP